MAKGYVSIPVGYRRVDNQPLEKNTLFFSYAEAKDYAENDPTAYPGQILSVLEGGKNSIYVVNTLNTLSLTSANALRYTPEQSPYQIQHDLHGYPTVKAINSHGKLVLVEVTYNDDCNITVTWNGAFAGFIVLE